MVRPRPCRPPVHSCHLSILLNFAALASVAPTYGRCRVRCVLVQACKRNSSGWRTTNSYRDARNRLCKTCMVVGNNYQSSIAVRFGPRHVVCASNRNIFRTHEMIPKAAEVVAVLLECRSLWNRKEIPAHNSQLVTGVPSTKFERLAPRNFSIDETDVQQTEPQYHKVTNVHCITLPRRSDPLAGCVPI